MLISTQGIAASQQFDSNIQMNTEKSNGSISIDNAHINNVSEKNTIANNSIINNLNSGSGSNSTVDLGGGDGSHITIGNEKESIISINNANLNNAVINNSSMDNSNIKKSYLNNVSLNNVITTDQGVDFSNQKITGLSDGINNNDAATVGQLDRGLANINSNTNAYTDQQISKAYSGIASVAAISSIPYLTNNTFSFGIGYGNYQNGNAIATGAQYKISSGTNLRVNVSWDNSNNTTFGTGFAMGW